MSWLYKMYKWQLVKLNFFNKADRAGSFHYRLSYSLRIIGALICLLLSAPTMASVACNSSSSGGVKKGTVLTATLSLRYFGISQDMPKDTLIGSSLNQNFNVTSSYNIVCYSINATPYEQDLYIVLNPIGLMDGGNIAAGRWSEHIYARFKYNGSEYQCDDFGVTCRFKLAVKVPACPTGWCPEVKLKPSDIGSLSMAYYKRSPAGTALLEEVNGFGIIPWAIMGESTLALLGAQTGDWDLADAGAFVLRFAQWPYLVRCNSTISVSRNPITFDDIHIRQAQGKQVGDILNVQNFQLIANKSCGQDYNFRLRFDVVEGTFGNLLGDSTEQNSLYPLDNNSVAIQLIDKTLEAGGWSKPILFDLPGTWGGGGTQASYAPAAYIRTHAFTNGATTMALDYQAQLRIRKLPLEPGEFNAAVKVNVYYR